MGNFYSAALEFNDGAALSKRSTGWEDALHCEHSQWALMAEENTFFISRHQSDGRRRHLDCATSLGAGSLVDFDGRRPTGGSGERF